MKRFKFPFFSKYQKYVATADQIFDKDSKKPLSETLKGGSGSNNGGSSSGGNGNPSSDVYDIYDETVDYKQFLTWVNDRTSASGNELEPVYAVYPEEFETVVNSWIAAANGKTSFVVKLNFDYGFSENDGPVVVSASSRTWVYINISLTSAEYDTGVDNVFGSASWTRLLLSWSDLLFTYNINIVMNLVPNDAALVVKAMLDVEEPCGVKLNCNMFAPYETISRLSVLLPLYTTHSYMSYAICKDIISCLVRVEDNSPTYGFLTKSAYKALWDIKILTGIESSPLIGVCDNASSDYAIIIGLEFPEDVNTGNFKFLTFNKGAGICIKETTDNYGIVSTHPLDMVEQDNLPK